MSSTHHDTSFYTDVLQDYQSEILDLTFQACVVQNCVNISTVMNGKAVIFNLSLERPPDLDKRIKLGPLESMYVLIHNIGTEL